MSKYAPDLARDPFYSAEQLSLGSRVCCPAACSSGLVDCSIAVGHLLRVVFGLHATWLVNSATHLWGRRRFNTRDDSRNNWWVA